MRKGECAEERTGGEGRGGVMRGGGCTFSREAKESRPVVENNSGTTTR